MQYERSSLALLTHVVQIPIATCMSRPLFGDSEQPRIWFREDESV